MLELSLERRELAPKPPPTCNQGDERSERADKSGNDPIHDAAIRKRGTVASTGLVEGGAIEVLNTPGSQFTPRRGGDGFRIAQPQRSVYRKFDYIGSCKAERIDHLRLSAGGSVRAALDLVGEPTQRTCGFGNLLRIACNFLLAHFPLRPAFLCSLQLPSTFRKWQRGLIPRKHRHDRLDGARGPPLFKGVV